MSIARIKRGDTVIGISGANAGQQGKVLKIDHRRGRVLVEGLNIVKKTIKRSNDYPEGGIVEREAPIAISNLMPYDEKAKKGVRIERFRDGDQVERRSRKSGNVLS